MSLYFDSPQDLGRTLDNGFSIYRASIKPLLALSFLTATLINLPSVANYIAVALGMGDSAAAGVGLVVTVIGVLLYMAGYLGLIFAQDAIARGHSVPSIGESFEHGLRRLGTMFLMGVLLALIVIVGFFLLIVPGVILSVSLGMAIYLVALEPIGPVDALKRSHALVWGHWWRTAVVLTVAVLLYAVPLILIAGIVGFAMAMSGAASGIESPEEKLAAFTIAMVVIQILAAGLLMPLMNGFMLAQFNDLKLRKSGADLLLRAPA